MKGKLKKIKQGEDYIFPVTMADGVFLDYDTSIKELLDPIKAGHSVYTVDLKRWGITEGVPNKPYVRYDYLIADANIQGINAAIQYASDNGFDVVKLPKGEYSLCYPRQIKMKSSLTLNLGGSTLKVIYDSDNKSPFDERQTDFYRFGGISISFENVTNAHLVNGKMLGCRYDRSFLNSDLELRNEDSYGVVISHGSHFCSVKYCDISGYMGDNISFSSTSLYTEEIKQGETSLNNLDMVTGALISSTDSLVTRTVNIPSGFTSFTINGGGYTRVTALKNKYVNVFFYDANDHFIGVTKGVKIYSHITIPNRAKKIKLVFLGEADPDKHYWVYLRFGLFPHHNLIEFNDIHDGHRGGITLGGSYNTIQHNIIRDNGKSSKVFQDDIPAFYDTTRYAINQEDSFGDNCVIRNNLVYGGFNGILIGCYDVSVTDNVIHNLDYSAISLYTVYSAKITGNVISHCGNSFGTNGTSLKNAHIFISENSVTETPVILDNEDYKIKITNNNFNNMTNIKLNSKTSFINNNITLSALLVINNGTLKSNEFSSTNNSKIRLEKISSVDDCKFTGVEFTPDSSVSSRTIKSCTFEDSLISDMAFNVKSKLLELTNCHFKDTIVKSGIINSPTSMRNLILKNCTIESVNTKYLIEADLNSGFLSIEMDNCSWFVSSSLINVLSLTKVSPSSVFLKISKSTISNSSQELISLALHNNNQTMNSILQYENELYNVVLQDDSKLMSYNPQVESPVYPKMGKFKSGDIVKNLDGLSNGYVGWYCYSGGYANDKVWSVNTLYYLNNLVNVDNKVYKCTVSGISGSLAPSHTSGIQTDGTASWEYLGEIALFKPFGLIAE